MDVLQAVMWCSFGLIVWTHVAYPLAAAAGARLRSYRPRRDDGFVPSVTLVIVAHDEAAVIGRRLDNALALDYPADRLEVVVASDGSTDGTNELVEQRGVRLVAGPRTGKTAAQDAAVRVAMSDVVAFSDANSVWEPGALRLLVRSLADPDVGYVCGRLRLADPESGANVEGLYWRYELWLRAQESGLGSITAGNGAIYAVRRSAYPELGSSYSHDIGLPYRLRRLGLRAVYEPDGDRRRAGRGFHGRRMGSQGADALALLVRHAARRDARPARTRRRLLPRAALAPAAALRERAAPRRAARLQRGARVELARRPRPPGGTGPVARPRRRRVALARACSAFGPGLVLPRRDRRVARLPRPHAPDGAATDLGSGGGHTLSGRGYRVAKRALDLGVAVVGIVVTAPFLALTALAIKLDDRGPVIFRQERIGRGGRPFQILKFRTMVTGAHLLGPGYLVSEGDPRISRVGAFLRRWSLDELPQLFNILRGEMSIVGPRPTLGYQVEQYSAFQRRRLEVPPGVTGWAQIQGRNELTWPERIELDVWYVDHRSLALDLKIVLRTFAVIVRPDEVYNEARADWGEDESHSPVELKEKRPSA